MEFEYDINGNLRTISLEKKGDTFIVSDGEESQEVDIRVISPNILSILKDGRSVRAYIAKDKNQLYIQLEGVQFLLTESTQLENGFQKGEERSQEDMLLIKAPMPGKVIKINVSENEKVRKNQTLAIVEAMKMENEIKSSIDGTVKKIYCKSGDLVETQNPLIELE
ncbi:acetyl-CoA carboxylase biotin carboxyl carrier protein subunit [Acidobacteriota bacterium]